MRWSSSAGPSDFGFNRRYSACVGVWRSPGVWQAVSAALLSFRQAGLTGVMTEDTVRFVTAKALVDAGCDPTKLRVEWPHPALAGSRIDLAVGRPVSAAVEFKFPREPVEKNAAWTMVLGEVLKDFYRLAACPGDMDRLFVYVESARLRRYMANSAVRYGLRLDAENVALHPADAARLPATAAGTIGKALPGSTVTARRLYCLPVDGTVRLAVYAVDALDQAGSDAGSAGNDPAAAAWPRVASGARSGSSAAPSARHEILDAVDAILVRSGATTFALSDVLVELRRRGSRYAESTIRTMVTSHMCANAPGHSGGTYGDLERIDRATYRRR